MQDLGPSVIDIVGSYLELEELRSVAPLFMGPTMQAVLNAMQDFERAQGRLDAAEARRADAIGQAFNRPGELRVVDSYLLAGFCISGTCAAGAGTYLLSMAGAMVEHAAGGALVAVGGVAVGAAGYIGVMRILKPRQRLRLATAATRAEMDARIHLGTASRRLAACKKQLRRVDIGREEDDVKPVVLHVSVQGVQQVNVGAEPGKVDGLLSLEQA